MYFYLSMYAILGVFMTYPFWLYLFFTKFGMEIKGCGLARSVCDFLNYVILYSVIKIWYKEEFK